MTAAIPNPKTALITNAADMGVASGAIDYTNLSTLTVLLGSGGNNATIATTAGPSTTTTLNSGSGADSIRINATSGPTIVNTGGGTNVNTVTIRNRRSVDRLRRPGRTHHHWQWA